MNSVIAVAFAWIVYAWMPPSPVARIGRLTGNQRAALDEQLFARWSARSLRTPGQARTTLLLEMLISELAAGLIPERAFTHVLGDRYTMPDAILAEPPTVDARVWFDVAHVWAASNEAGFSMAGALRRIHAYALVDQEVAREVQSTAAAPKFALLTVMAMPVAAWLLAKSMGARPFEFLFHTIIGAACLVITLLLDGLAAFWMSRLTKRAMA